MKLEQGDSFESRHANWIRQALPHYEHVWSAFIGHDGKGWPCPIIGLDPDAETDRKRFYQAHYSFACRMFGHSPDQVCPLGYNVDIDRRLERKLCQAYDATFKPEHHPMTLHEAAYTPAEIAKLIVKEMESSAV